MNTNNIIAVAVLGFLAWKYLPALSAPAQPAQPPYPKYPNIPPAPPQGTPKWQNWVNAILETYGSVAELWQEGGPFNSGTTPPIMPGTSTPHLRGRL